MMPKMSFNNVVACQRIMRLSPSLRASATPAGAARKAPIGSVYYLRRLLRLIENIGTMFSIDSQRLWVSIYIYLGTLTLKLRHSFLRYDRYDRN